MALKTQIYGPLTCAFDRDAEMAAIDIRELQREVHILSNYKKVLEHKIFNAETKNEETAAKEKLENLHISMKDRGNKICDLLLWLEAVEYDLEQQKSKAQKELKEFKAVGKDIT